jgi:tetratricopeptide (TPR) repeat protein
LTRRPLDRLPALGAGLLLTLIAASCVPALREPPSLELLAETTAVPEDQAATALMEEAQSLFAQRDMEAARRATHLTLHAALNPHTRHMALVETVRVQLWIAHNEEDSKERAALATRAVDVAVWCGRTAPGDPACDYWLGAALGIQAQERRSTGLSALPEIEAAFLRAVAAAPDLESAAPDRGLALFYLRAPGWPTGPGDPDLGLEHARAAVERFPQHPANLMALAEALKATGDREDARATWQQALTAAEAFTASGDPDGPAWRDEAAQGLKRATR